MANRDWSQGHAFVYTFITPLEIDKAEQGDIAEVVKTNKEYQKRVKKTLEKAKKTLEKIDALQKELTKLK